MTSFLDVIRPLTDQLESLDNKTRVAAARYSEDTTQFQNYTISGVSGISGGVPFLGQGADACIAAVKRNVSRAQHVITKLSDFQLACDQTKKGLEDMSRPFDDASLYYLNSHDLYGLLSFRNADRYRTFEIDYFQLAQGYSPYDTTDPNMTIIWRIREDTLPGLSWQLDTLLTPGKGQGLMEEQITYAVSCIQSDFQRYQSKRHEDISDALHNNEIEKDAYTYYIADADGSYKLAMHYVDVIAEKMKRGYTEWVTELQVLVEQFRLDVATAAAINEPSIGDLITQVTTGPDANAKVLVWQTPNGLVVVVKGGTDAASVEQAIQNYMDQHGLKGNTAITLLGYKDGGSVAQQMVLDEANGNYHVTNLVLVGSQLWDNLPEDINKFAYQAPPKDQKEEEATYLGLKPDQIFIPAAAVVVGLLTDGLGDIPLLAAVGGEATVGVATEYALAEGWNATARKWNKEHPGEPIPEMQAGESLPIYVDTGDGSGIHQITIQEETLLVNGKLPQARIYFKQSQIIVPTESGADLTNFTKSSFLNSQTIPDPGTEKLPHGGALPVSG
jgi:hypothetical protein